MAVSKWIGGIIIFIAFIIAAKTQACDNSASLMTPADVKSNTVVINTII